MDMGSGSGYPAANLSNSTPHPFVIDGSECASMEGFLQSLKYKNIAMQKHVCTLVRRQAKLNGKRKNWYKKQTLYLLGKEYKRSSKDYQDLLDMKFNELSKNEKFRKALMATGNDKLSHSIDKKQRILNSTDRT